MEVHGRVYAGLRAALNLLSRTRAIPFTRLRCRRFMNRNRGVCGRYTENTRRDSLPITEKEWWSWRYTSCHATPGTRRGPAGTPRHFFRCFCTAFRVAVNVNISDSRGMLLTKGPTSQPNPTGMSRVSETDSHCT